MAEPYGVGYLKNKLRQKEIRVKLRYRYYEMKEKHSDQGLLIPNWMKDNYRATVGWCAKSVDALADRLVFQGFEPQYDDYGANQIFEFNNPDIFYDSVIKESLIGSCSFVHITHGEGGELTPRLSVLTAKDATGIIDEQTGLLKEGYAVLDRDKDRPTRSRKIDPKANKTEDVFVLRVYGDAPVTPPRKPKCKLVKRAISKPSPQLTELLNDVEEVEEND